MPKGKNATQILSERIGMKQLEKLGLKDCYLDLALTVQVHKPDLRLRVGNEIKVFVDMIGEAEIAWLYRCNQRPGVTAFAKRSGYGITMIVAQA